MTIDSESSQIFTLLHIGVIFMQNWEHSTGLIDGIPVEFMLSWGNRKIFKGSWMNNHQWNVWHDKCESKYSQRLRAEAQKFFMDFPSLFHLIPKHWLTAGLLPCTWLILLLRLLNLYQKEIIPWNCVQINLLFAWHRCLSSSVLQNTNAYNWTFSNVINNFPSLHESDWEDNYYPIQGKQQDCMTRNSGKFNTQADRCISGLQGDKFAYVES